MIELYFIKSIFNVYLYQYYENILNFGIESYVLFQK